MNAKQLIEAEDYDRAAAQELLRSTKPRKRAIMAGVTNLNTPESDARPEVWHTVQYDDGTTDQVFASDPMIAIQIANRWQHES